MNQDSDLDNDIDLQTDNEEDFFDDFFFLHPDKERPNIEMLDQSLSSNSSRIVASSCTRVWLHYNWCMKRDN